MFPEIGVPKKWAKIDKSLFIYRLLRSDLLTPGTQGKKDRQLYR